MPSTSSEGSGNGALRSHLPCAKAPLAIASDPSVPKTALMSATRNTLPDDIAFLPCCQPHANLACAGVDATVQIGRLGKLKLASCVRRGNLRAFLFVSSARQGSGWRESFRQQCAHSMAPAPERARFLVFTLLLTTVSGLGGMHFCRSFAA